jgi:hypothetical protein
MAPHKFTHPRCGCFVSLKRIVEAQSWRLCQSHAAHNANQPLDLSHQRGCRFNVYRDYGPGHQPFFFHINTPTEYENKSDTGATQTRCLR